MLRYIFAIFLIFSTSQIWAETPGMEELRLAKVEVNALDIDSIKRGAKFFATNCMSCHTMVYMRYNKLAQEAGVTYEKMPINVKTWPYGITPPDLSLEADVRGPDWIYTYLHSFYKDPARPTGANNLLVNNTAMPYIISPYQGEQVLSTPTPNAEGIFHITEWYDLVTLNKQGTMTPAEFDKTVMDVVNFLSYASSPYRADQEKIGFWVICFLIVLAIMMYMLKREYWKDVKKHRAPNDDQKPDAVFDLAERPVSSGENWDPKKGVEL